ncbi:hypothetical protein PG991_000659 [Apiospora marii]|uniref:Uncharacterized protein n=1 Tax=Apiospora marii TaxID=335849 RepID=A0ABR1SSL6_9PEZI
MPNSFNSEYSNYYGANDELDDGDGTRDRSGVPFGPKAPAPPRSRQPLPSGSGTAKDVPDGDAPGRVEHEGHDRQPEKSGRRRHLSIIGEPSGNRFRLPFSGKPNIQVQANGDTWSDQVEHNGTEQETWADSDAESDPHVITSRRSRAAREPAPDHSRRRDEDGGRVGITGNRAVHQPQSTYYGGRGEGEPYAGRRYDNPGQVYRDTPSRPLGEMARYQNYYNRDPNPFAGQDDYTKQSYFGGPHRYAPPMGPYPGQALTYAQPMSYAQPSSYQPWQFPYNYGYPQPQPFSFSAPPPPPETPPPAPPVRNYARSDKNDMDSVLKKVLRELEDNKKKLADKDDIIQKFKSKDRESEMLDKAKSTEARAEQMREQIKSELEAAAQKRLEDERQELAKREYQEKLNRAASDIREQLEQQLREEENRKKAEEQRILGLEADLRRRIEAEMVEEQERRKREAEKRLYLEMEIREKIIAEREESRRR